MLIIQNIDECVMIEGNIEEATMSATKQNSKYDVYSFFKTLENRFIIGRNYNAKNSFLESRLTGRELHTVMKHSNLNYLSTRLPT